jgi:hypothetical protein
LPVAPFSGAIYSDTGCATKINDLAAGCLYIGGGANNRTLPSPTPDGGLTKYDVASCVGDTLNLVAHPLLPDNDPKTCSQGVAATRHCSNNPAVACTVDNDCVVAGAGLFCLGDARCYFGPPIHINALGNASCVINVFRQDAVGTVDKVTGVNVLNIQLDSRTYLTANAASPCPKCSGGLCTYGKRAGLPCTESTAGDTSVDCPPLDGSFVGNLAVSLNPLQTSPQLTNANAAGTFCPPMPPPSGVGTCGPGPGYTNCPGQKSAGAFGRPTTRCVQESGQDAPGLNDFGVHAGRLAAIFCIPSTSNATVNTVADLPGPGATSITGNYQLIP